jgi:hypothetical protein
MVVVEWGARRGRRREGHVAMYRIRTLCIARCRPREECHGCGFDGVGVCVVQGELGAPWAHGQGEIESRRFGWGGGGC